MGWYWRWRNVKSFDEFLERRFPESRRQVLLSLKHLRPLLRALVDGEDHDVFFLDAICNNKGGIRNNQLTSAADAARSP